MLPIFVDELRPDSGIVGHAGEPGRSIESNSQIKTVDQERNSSRLRPTTALMHATSWPLIQFHPLSSSQPSHGTLLQVRPAPDPETSIPLLDAPRGTMHQSRVGGPRKADVEDEDDPAPEIS